EIDIPVAGHIGMAGGNEILDNLDDLANMLGGTGADSRRLDVESVGILDVFSLKPAGHRIHRDAFGLAFGDELVVNVGDVRDIDHLVAAVFEVAAQRIKDDHRPGIADVDVVIDGRPADIDAVNAGFLGDE